MKEFPELLTPDELAKILKIPRNPGVYDLVSQRKIPHLKIGGRLRFVKKDIMDYIEKSRVEPIRLKDRYW
ncbi:helix-turn-helix domain-containing protein [Candidatus Parcubacteria bacterium]|nr:helix-turn-helix domain-containing protein [Candidatus Parcubacteria bacterium]